LQNLESSGETILGLLEIRECGNPVGGIAGSKGENLGVDETILGFQETFLGLEDRILECGKK